VIRDPSAHEAHEMPLAGRIIDRLIGAYIAHAGDIALAGNGYSGAEEEGFRKGVEQMRYLHLSGWDYRLTPKILDELRRAGLLRDREEETS
jgi:hypothetical protein